MSTNTDPTRGCTGKQRYRKFLRAKFAADRAAKATEEHYHAYKCRRCNHFHVGHYFPRRKPEMRRDD